MFNTIADICELTQAGWLAVLTLWGSPLRLTLGLRDREITEYEKQGILKNKLRQCYGNNKNTMIYSGPK